MKLLCLCWPSRHAESRRDEPTVSSEKTTAPLSIHDMLVDCAGAIAAEGNVDPLVEPSTGTREENALWTVLALMDKEPGLFGVAGRKQPRNQGRVGDEVRTRTDGARRRMHDAIRRRLIGL